MESWLSGVYLFKYFCWINELFQRKYRSEFLVNDDLTLQGDVKDPHKNPNMWDRHLQAIYRFSIQKKNSIIIAILHG